MSPPLCSVYLLLPFSEFLLGQHEHPFGIFINLVKIVFLEDSNPEGLGKLAKDMQS